MASGKLTIATCQFIVSNSIEMNAGWIEKFMREARDGGAEIVHFSETALPGYGGANHANFDSFDWEMLRSRTRKIMELARKLGVWVVLGSMHQLTEPNKPHNCLYLINSQGQIAARYDKRFCTAGDLDFYTPGSRFVTFTFNDVKCALLICFDLRFPEIYRALKKQGVECIFQSFYNAGTGPNVHTHIMRQTMQGNAASNYFWVSMANTAGPKSPYPSCFISPDGVIQKQLKLGRPGMMINIVDVTKSFYDPSAPFRDAAIAGALGNGPVVNDPRSEATDCL